MPLLVGLDRTVHGHVVGLKKTREEKSFFSSRLVSSVVNGLRTEKKKKNIRKLEETDQPEMGIFLS